MSVLDKLLQRIEENYPFYIVLTGLILLGMILVGLTLLFFSSHTVLSMILLLLGAGLFFCFIEDF